MQQYHLLLFAYIVIFSTANLIASAVNFLFAKISRSSLEKHLKRAELTPLESAYLVFKEFPDELGDYIGKRTKAFTTYSVIYLIAIEFLDLVGLYYSKDSVLVCRISIALIAVSVIALIIFAPVYIHKAKKINKSTVAQIEILKKECEKVLEQAMNSENATVTSDSAAGKEEIIQGKKFLEYAVLNQLINEVIPEDYFESPLD